MRSRTRTLLLAGAALALAVAAGWGCARRPPVGIPGEAPPAPTPESRERALQGEGKGHTLEHAVVPGETLDQIADNYYGDPGKAHDIAAENGLREGARLAPGSTLVLRFDGDEWQRAEQRSAAMPAYNRGVDLLEKGRLEAADEQFRSALEAAPDFLGARYNLALVWMKRGSYDQAEKELGDLVHERPRDTDFLFAHGSVLFYQARYGDAADEFRRLLAVAPGHRQGAFSLARSLQEAGRKRDAIAAWEAYLKLDSRSAWADTARRCLSELRGG